MADKILSMKVDKVDPNKPGVYFIKDGELRMFKAPPTGFGTQKIIWQNGKPVRVELTVSEKL